MTPSDANVVLCNMVSADSVARSLGSQCGVLSYSIPLPLERVPPKTVLILRPTLKDTLQEDRVSMLEVSIERCFKQGIFVVLCTTPRFGGGLRASKVVTSSNLRCMELAARHNAGLFDLDLVLAYEGAHCYRNQTDELSDIGISAATGALQRMLGDFITRIPLAQDTGN